MSNPVLTFKDLTLGYDRHPAVHHLDGTLQAGSLTAVVGANGSGKSTLMKGVAGILKPMSGSIAVAAGARLAYLPQQSEIDRSFPAAGGARGGGGLWARPGQLGRASREDRMALGQALSSVGLSGFESRPIDTLSGGQMQRALFARVCLQDANLILLDEPFNAVDAETVADLLTMIDNWRDQGRTVMVVLHDLDLARAHFPQALLLARRPVAWGPTADVLSPDNLRGARDFEEAWRNDAPWCAEDDLLGQRAQREHVHAHPHRTLGHDHHHA